MAGRGGSLTKNGYSCSPKLEILICIAGIAALFIILQTDLHIYPSSSSLDLKSLYRKRRSKLYDAMAKDFDEKGLSFLNHSVHYGSFSDSFTIRNGSVTPVLTPAIPPARANALHLPAKFSTPISIAVHDTFGRYYNQAIWFQKPSLYHFSMFHASHHLFPVPATQDEVEEEARAVQNVVQSLCPLEVFLDRVILTSSGVLLGCWQVTSGPDPIIIRSKLRSALPRAPEKQSNDPAILHTSLARLLGHPISSSMKPTGEIRFLHELVALLNDKIRGFKAVVSEFWNSLQMGSQALINDIYPGNDQRSKLYNQMESDLEEKGLTIPHIGNSSSDNFTLKDCSVTPILRPSDLPVRTNVLHLSTKFSIPIWTIVQDTFKPYFDKAIWFQNHSLYHFTMFQTSHQKSPVLATENEVEEEASAVRSVADRLEPLQVFLDRVILTSTGVLVGCWQMMSGSDPITVRSELRAALPKAPEIQAYDDAILHTSFARLLGFPVSSDEVPSSEHQILQNLVDRLNNRIRGFEASITELWFVEELDVMALALNGRMTIRQFQLGGGTILRP